MIVVCNKPPLEKSMLEIHQNNPLHALKLEVLLTELVDHYGWSELGQRVDIRCFTNDPSVRSSLKLLRKNPWARKKVEDLYLSTVQKTDS